MPDVTERACPVCAAGFMPYRNGDRVQQYCSATCASRADVRRLPARPCDECGAQFLPKNHRGRFCSSLCRFRHVERGRKRPGRVKRLQRCCVACGHGFVARSEASYCSDDCRRFKDSPASVVPWAECGWCGHWFVRRSGRRYCSEQCMRANCPGTRRSSPIGYGDCAECGSSFVRREGQAGAYCSLRCRRKADKRTRRHRLRAAGGAESFTLREIADRDGWRCHMCGRKVPDREFKARKLDATLDHLIPVSAGGTHTRDNVALAHFKCNYERREFGEVQLRLAG